mmetsp:Transcript_4574/g.6681  ORF Transcript_4574/g.6681 Transcript_4574/m.6681 type:complete len:110 (-) Transcript_4574:237-566(-)|eukprot:CAMPEP_0194073816 /NCGR_PEP_ID=MMETSP0149-20130528/1076_1 /TAXON_ID=122233 /ORGANISM="Chaetoceros debilis, Strain MM31A-1" /LENGTH=109 /DNA_ID=CAMNT_0038753861 /DNA_START=199 /DNA_END=528 /DNA_ORIENTATION=+
MAPKKQAGGGGLKGFFSRAGKSFMTGGLFAQEKSIWAAEKICRIGFILATTSIVVFMPLVFEIAREGQMIESEKLEVGALRDQGYADNQLREMGYAEPAIARAPAVLKK